MHCVVCVGYCWVSDVCCLLVGVWCLPYYVRCMLFTIYGVPVGVWCLVVVVCCVCVLFVDCGGLRVMLWVMYVVCRLLHVCCGVDVAWCMVCVA